MSEQESQKDKATVTGLAKKLGQLPADKKRAALELSAALAGVSLRVSREFVEAVAAAGEILSADELREWAEFGRRLAMGSAETGAKYFRLGAEGLAQIDSPSRSDVFQVCTRQLVLSSSTALNTFTSVAVLARIVDDEKLFSRVMALAVEIAQRSAKHSSDFLENTPALVAALRAFGNDRDVVTDAIFGLAAEFANRTGGMTADLWKELPGSVTGLTPEQCELLLRRAGEFLGFGGSVTLNFIAAGGEILRHVPDTFEDWNVLSREIARHGNAVLISFLRVVPRSIRDLPRIRGVVEADPVRRVFQLTRDIARTDAESALAAFRSSTIALKKVSLSQFDEWVENGLSQYKDETAKARRSYFALETRESNERLHKTRLGLSLDSVQTVLRLYIEALTGREIAIAPLSAMPQENRIGDGKTIYLPTTVAEFSDDEMDFRLFKVLAAHGSGQIEFGTFDRDTTDLRSAYTELTEIYSMTPDERDAFSLDGYLDKNKIQDQRSKVKELPLDSDYRAVLAAFPEPRLARKIFGTMENARIDHCLRASYRGLRKDLDLMQSYLRSHRPYIFDLPMHQVPFELLFQITLCGGATDDARMFYGQVVSEIEGVIDTFIYRRAAEINDIETGDLKMENESSNSEFSILNSQLLPTVADSIMATSRIYTLFQNITPEQTQEAESDDTETDSEFAYEDKEAAESVTEDQVKREQQRQQQDISELFNAWNSLDDEGEPDDLQGAEAWGQNEVPEQDLESGDVAFAYDEWDRELGDYRLGWSRVIEKRVKQGDRSFVELTRSRYRGVISSIRHQFQLMKPENLTRVNREFDGEDYDLNALVDFVIDRRADGLQAENIYTKRLRKRRDVAVSLLLDQSSSTARTITRNPLQPYTHPGRRIIEIEKEGLVLMSEALEAVGDLYSINGFTSEGRRNVKFYVVKDFDESYGEATERRIGGITFQNNTRLGAAVRHAAAKLLRQESRTKLLIILTDGRPYDHDYGDARYAREDVREALLEAKASGITPFCITVDRESEAELRDLYGDVGYTIIDDVLSLPERMPSIYRRLTS